MSKNNHSNKWLSIFQQGKFVTSTRITLDVVWHIALFFIVIGFVLMFFLGGLGLGYFASLVEDIPAGEKEEMRKQIYNYEETSHVYFANNIHMGELRSDLHREEIKLENVSPLIRNAIKATEDEYFDTHNGIVPKAIMRAIFQEFTNADMQSGGSTLTQQLIKSQILTNEVSFERKAKEILIALRLENFFEKDEIFEAYLNIVPFGRDSSGRNIAGVQSAAQGIFDKDADDLNLAQAAYIAGLPQSPSAYTPFKNGGELKSEEGLQPGFDRQYVVLDRMLEEDMITQEEFDEALAFDLVGSFTDKKESTLQNYPFLTIEIEKRAKKILLEQLASEDGYTMEELNENNQLYDEYDILAERHLRQNGYDVHTTIEKDIYDKFQEVTANYEHFKPTHVVTRTDSETGETYNVEFPVETGATLIENDTGKILAFVGGRDFEVSQVNKSFHHVRPNGSTMKPLFGYGPAMEEGIVQPGSPLLDVQFTYNPPVGKAWTPANYVQYQQDGIETVRQALYKSDNLPPARMAIDMVEQGTDIGGYLRKMGLGRIVPENNFLAPPAVLGSRYVTVEENTSAYTTFANGGKHAESYMIERIEDKEGNVIFERETKETEVFSPQTAYLMTDTMRDVLTQGTGTFVRRNLNNPSVDWAGKSGTTNDWQDTWFVASNPKVTLGTWIGYESYDADGDGDPDVDRINLRNCTDCSLRYSWRVQGYWADLVNSINDIAPDKMTPEERHESPGGIVQRSYCKISGLLPSDACSKLGLVGTDLFNIDYVPTKRDDSVIEGQFVQIGDEYYAAIDQTPEEFVNEGYFLRPGFLEDMGWDDVDDLSKLVPDNDTWENLIAPEEDNPENNGTPPSPSGVSISNGALTWNEVGGDVIGYRIYIANDENSDFRRIDSTTELSQSLPHSNRLYAVTAVDFYGNESSMSKPVVYGRIVKPEEENDDDEDNDSGGSDDSGDGSSDDGNSEDGSSDGGSDGDSENNGSNDSGSDSGSETQSEDGNSGGSDNGGNDSGGSNDESSGTGDSSNNS